MSDPLNAFDEQVVRRWLQVTRIYFATPPGGSQPAEERAPKASFAAARQTSSYPVNRWL